MKQVSAYISQNNCNLFHSENIQRILIFHSLLIALLPFCSSFHATAQSEFKIQTFRKRKLVIIYHDVYTMILDEGFQNTSCEMHVMKYFTVFASIKFLSQVKFTHYIY
jgi:hypothetical protein